MSSANMISLPAEIMVTMLSINSKEPSILPCGAPDTTGSLLYRYLSNATT